MEYKDVSKELPYPKAICFVKRKNGEIYLAFRRDAPLYEGADPGRECHWYGYKKDSSNYYKDQVSNFSDVTVVGWRYVTSEDLSD